jgi:GDP-D-mannose dehydratase
MLGTVYPQQVEAQPPEPCLRLRHADLRDPEGVRALVDEVQPDYIFHLAAQSFVPASFSDPWDTLENNIRAELNLLEAVRRSERDVRMLVVGSNEEYGAPRPEELTARCDLTTPTPSARSLRTSWVYSIT